LIAYNANVNIQKNDGATPVIVAVTNKQDKMISLLVEASADLSIKNNNGDTPLSLAQSTKFYAGIAAMSAGSGGKKPSFQDVKCITVQVPQLSVTRKLPFNPGDSISDFIESHFKDNPRSPIPNLEEYGLFSGDKFLVCGTLGFYKITENDLLTLRHLTEDEKQKKKQEILKLIEEMQYGYDDYGEGY